MRIYNCFISIFLTLLLITLTGCAVDKNKTQSIDQEDYHHLVEENESLKDQVSQLNNKEKNLNQQIKSLEQLLQNYEDTINAYQHVFQQISDTSNVLTEQFSIFSLENIKQGDSVAGLTVSNVTKEERDSNNSYFIGFDGEFEVSGSVIINQVSGGKYAILVSENLHSIPHTINDYERGVVYFTISNSEALEEVMGEELKELDDFNSVEINAVFRDFSYNYVPETDVSNSAEFIRLE
ncbi:hypothetical protein ACLIA0_08740 [Bacillaceae bacterium W0354]